MSEPTPRLSVIIPVRDDPPVFRAVESLLAAVAGRDDTELIVVDNGSRPAFRASLGGLPAVVQVVDEPASGAGAARNRGVEVANGDILLFTDADCVVHPDWLEEALRGLEATDADVLVGSWGAVKSTPSAAWIEGALAPHRPRRAGRPARLNARNFAARRSVFEQVRFNVENARAEDIEFGLEAESRGLKVLHWPAMRVDHEHEATIVEFAAKRIASGWQLRRLRVERKDLGSPYRARGRALPALGKALRVLPFRRAAAASGVRALLGLCRLVDRFGLKFPQPAAIRAVGLLAPLSNAAGGYLFDAGYAAPNGANLLKGRMPGRRPRRAM